MGGVTAIIAIDLCSDFPVGSLCALGTDNPRHQMGLGKVGKKCKRGKNVLTVIFVVSSPFQQEHLIRVTQFFNLGTMEILGWITLCCRMAVVAYLCILGR